MFKCNIKRKIWATIKELDIFGQSIKLYLNKREMYKTFLGGLLTFGMLIAVIILSINSFFDLTQRSGVNVQQNVDFQLNPQILQFTKQNFMFAISTDDASVNMTNSIYGFEVIQNIYIRGSDGNLNKTKTKIPLKICESSDFNIPNFNEQYVKYNLANSLCPSYDTMQIAGEFISDLFAFIQINVKNCTNGTYPQVTCASPDAIHKYQQVNRKTRVQLFFQNYIINSLNYESPVSTFLDQFAWVLSPNSYTLSNDVYIRESLIETASNFFGYGDPGNQGTFRYAEEIVEQIYTSDGINFVSINFRKSNYYEKYFRKYKTVGDVFAIIGGFWNFLFIAIGLFVFHFNGKKYNLKLANSLYDFEQLEDSKDSPTKNQKVKLTSWELIKSMFCCSQRNSTPKTILIQKAINRIRNEVDIVEIMSKLQEINKFKEILLNTKQQQIFNNHLKPAIKIRDDDPTKSDIIETRKSSECLENEGNKNNNNDEGYTSPNKSHEILVRECKYLDDVSSSAQDLKHELEVSELSLQIIKDQENKTFTSSHNHNYLNQLVLFLKRDGKLRNYIQEESKSRLINTKNFLKYLFFVVERNYMSSSL